MPSFPYLGPQYKFIKQLKVDDTGVINLAVNNLLGYQVVIKTFRRGNIDGPWIGVPYHTLQGINHPNIISIKKVIVNPHNDGNIHFVEKYFKGRTLHSYIRKISGPIPSIKALSMMKTIVSTIAYFHRYWHTHSHINPKNVLIGDNGDIKVSGLGMPPSYSVGPHLRRFLMTNIQEKIIKPEFVFNLIYMAPEQVNVSDEKIHRLWGGDKKTDIYALGILLHNMITASPPYAADTTKEEAELICKIKFLPLDRVHDLYPGADNRIQKIIDKATANNPVNRYQNCDELYSDIHNTEIEITNSL